MLREGPFDIAERRGSETGACPVTLLDAFFTNHATFDELCAEFTCKDCVATDEDMGFGSVGDEPPIRIDEGGGDWEIPF